MPLVSIKRCPNGWIVLQDCRALGVFADEMHTRDPSIDSFGKASSFVLGLKRGEIVDGDAFKVIQEQGEEWLEFGKRRTTEPESNAEPAQEFCDKCDHDIQLHDVMAGCDYPGCGCEESRVLAKTSRK